MRQFPGVLLTGVVAVAAGCLAFHAGQAHGIAATEAGSAGDSDGVRRLGHGPMHGHGHGYGHWGSRAGSRAERRHQWIAEAHRRLHEEDAAAAAAAGEAIATETDGAPAA